MIKMPSFYNTSLSPYHDGASYDAPELDPETEDFYREDRRDREEPSDDAPPEYEPDESDYFQSLTEGNY